VTARCRSQSISEVASAARRSTAAAPEPFDAQRWVLATVSMVSSASPSIGCRVEERLYGSGLDESAVL
jgi:hypothetical protein